MPKTNYKDCWWLIQTITGEFGKGSFPGKELLYNLRDLNNFRPPHERVKYDWFSMSEPAKKERDSFRHDIMRQRAIIYNEFGLAILMKSDPGKDRGKGEGGYYYYLANPELLDDGSKTLREHIKFLADSEKDRESWATLKDMEKHFGASSLSMGFISAGRAVTRGYLSSTNTTPRTILGEENLALVQFAMKFGEVLTIKYGKVTTGIDINAPYSFEPYQVKEIERRWYAIGNLYPMGHKESAELAVYDLARLEFMYDEENPDVLYEPVEGFEVNEYIHSKAISLKLEVRQRIIGVRVIDIKTHLEEFTGYIKKNPLCSAQENLGGGRFRIYVRITNDFIVQMGAYGEELSLGLLEKEGEERIDRNIIHKGLNLFRNGDVTNFEFE